MKKVKRKGKRKSNNNLAYILIILLVGTAICSLVAYYTGNGALTHSMKEDGYTTEDQGDAFYRQIVTNNTLDDYYDDISKKKDSNYEEYYLSKESLDYMEMKLSYYNGTSLSVNITSDLRSLDTTFHLELSKENSYLLLEGNSKNNYSCETITQRSVGNDIKREYCDWIQDEVNKFLEKRNQIMTNPQVQEILSNPMKQYVSGDDGSYSD